MILCALAESLYKCLFVLQEGDFLVRTHHVEYCDGGILDPDDVLTDLVEDKDRVKHLQRYLSIKGVVHLYLI